MSSGFWVKAACIITGAGALVVGFAPAAGWRESSAQARDAADPFARIEQWVRTVAQSEPLADADAARAKTWIAQLDADDYETREAATLALLLQPKGVGALLWEARSTPSAEARSRIKYLLDEHTFGQPMLSYLARVAGLVRDEVLMPLQTGGASLDHLLDRIPPAKVTDDLRLWALLVLAAEGETQMQRVLGMLQARLGRFPTVELYDAMFTHYREQRPIQRARLLDGVMIAGGKEATELDLALRLAERSSSDRQLDVRRARSRLVSRLALAFEGRSLLDRFRKAQEPERKRLLLEMVRLSGADQSLRLAWLAVGEEIADEALGEAFVEMACREGLNEILTGRIDRGDRSPRLFALLAAVGTTGDWQRVLAPGSATESISAALSWLPYSRLAPPEQRDILLAQLASEANPELRSTALQLLGGYGCHATVQALLKLLESPGAPVATASILARHAWLLPPFLPDPFATAWFQASDARIRAAILRAYHTPQAEAALEDLLYAVDPQAADMAAMELAQRGTGFISIQLRAVLATSGFRFDTRDIVRLHADPEQAWSRLVALENKRSTQAPDFSEKDASEAKSLAIALALAAYPELREAIEAQRLSPPEREALLCLYPDAKGKAAQVSALAFSPRGVLALAPLYVLLGREQVVIDALVACSRVAADDTQLAGMLRLVEPGLLARVVVSPAGREALRPLIETLTRSTDDAVVKACLDPLAINMARAPYLDALLAVSKRSAREQYRTAILYAASGARELDQAFIDRIKERFGGESSVPLENAMALLEAVLAGDADMLASLAQPSQHTGVPRLAALLHIARMGDPAALIVAMNQVYDVNPESIEEFSGAIDAWNMLPFDLSSLCLGVPEGFKPEQQRAFWFSTRYLWRFDAGQRIFVRGEGA